MLWSIFLGRNDSNFTVECEIEILQFFCSEKIFKKLKILRHPTSKMLTAAIGLVAPMSKAWKNIKKRRNLDGY